MAAFTIPGVTVRKFATQDTLGTIERLYRELGRVWVNCHTDTATRSLFDFQQLKGIPQYFAQFAASCMGQVERWQKDGGVLLQRVQIDPAIQCEAVVLLAFPMTPHDFERAARRTTDVIVVTRPSVSWALIERSLVFHHPTVEQARVLYFDMRRCLTEALSPQHKLILQALNLDPEAYIVVNQDDVQARTGVPEPVQNRLYNNHNNFTHGMVSKAFRLVRLLQRPSVGLMQEAYDQLVAAPEVGEFRVLDREHPVKLHVLGDLQRMGSIYCHPLLHARPVPRVAPAYERIAAQHRRERALFDLWREEIRSWLLYEETPRLPACAPAACSDA